MRSCRSGTLTPDDVEVQLIHGVAGQGDELADPEIVVLEQGGAADDGHLRYRGQLRVRARRSLWHDRADRPEPPGARHAGRARPDRLGLSAGYSGGAGGGGGGGAPGGGGIVDPRGAGGGAGGGGGGAPGGGGGS